MEGIGDNVGLMYAAVHLEIFEKEVFASQLH